jgi:ribosome-associated protein
VDIFALGLAPYAFRKLKELAGSKMTVGGELIVTARTHRSREANREEARRRVIALLDKAHERQAPRVKTKPSRAAKARRVDTKKVRSSVKKNRGKPGLD